jgi:hypothetical protein
MKSRAPKNREAGDGRSRMNESRAFSGLVLDLV